MKSVALMLIYEPLSAQAAPVPIVRVLDNSLIVAVAEAAVSQADDRARQLAGLDEVLGQMEEIEAQRLRTLLAFLIPELSVSNPGRGSPTPVM